MVHGGVVVLKSFFLVLLCCQASGLMFDRLKKGIDGGIPCASMCLVNLVRLALIVINACLLLTMFPVLCQCKCTNQAFRVV